MESQPINPEFRNNQKIFTNAALIYRFLHELAQTVYLNK